MPQRFAVLSSFACFRRYCYQKRSSITHRYSSLLRVHVFTHFNSLNLIPTHYVSLKLLQFGLAMRLQRLYILADE